MRHKLDTSCFILLSARIFLPFLMTVSVTGQILAQNQIPSREQSGNQGEKARRILADLGLTGSISPLGFVVEKVKEKSLAEKAGFKPDDTITLVDQDTIADLSSLSAALKKYQESFRTSSVIIIRPGTVKEIAWPPFEEQDANETGLKQAKISHEFGSRALAEGDYPKAIGFLQSSILASINYPARSEVFQQLAEAYLAMIKEIGEREKKTYLVPISTQMTLEQAKDRLAYAQQTATSIQRYSEIVRVYLRHSQLERMRAGSPLTATAEEKDDACLRESKQLTSAYEEVFFPYQKALLAYIEALDFTRWLKAEMESVWELYDRKSLARRTLSYLTGSSPSPGGRNVRETQTPFLQVLFSPVARVTLINLSRQYSFCGQIEVQFRGNQNNLKASQQVSLAPGEKKEFLLETAKKFEGTEVISFNPGRERLTAELLLQNLKPWQAELFINGKSYGRIPIKF